MEDDPPTGAGHAQLRFVERLGLLLRESGIPRMPARVFACLLADDADGLTAGALAERLQVSPAAISGAVRYLVDTGIAVREREPGARSDHYRLGDDLWYEMYASRMDLLRRWETTMADGAEILGRDRRGGRRLDESRAFLAFLHREFGEMLERWRAHRAELGIGSGDSPRH